MARTLVLATVIASLLAGSIVLAFASVAPYGSPMNSSFKAVPGIQSDHKGESGSVCADTGKMTPTHVGCGASAGENMTAVNETKTEMVTKAEPEESTENVIVADRIRPANETSREDFAGATQPEPFDNELEIIARFPEIIGPGAGQCRDVIMKGFEAVLATEHYRELEYIDKYVNEIYCNDVVVIIPGIPYEHIAYVLDGYEDRMYINPQLYRIYNHPEQVARTLFHEARHLEQYKECTFGKWITGGCMNQEKREKDAQKFDSEMIDKIFPGTGSGVVIVPPVTTVDSHEIIVLNNGTETITPRMNSTITIIGNGSDPESRTVLDYSTVEDLH